MSRNSTAIVESNQGATVLNASKRKRGDGHCFGRRATKAGASYAVCPVLGEVLRTSGVVVVSEVLRNNDVDNAEVRMLRTSGQTNCLALGFSRDREFQTNPNLHLLLLLVNAFSINLLYSPEFGIR
jgi:hypothetical protein